MRYEVLLVVETDQSDDVVNRAVDQAWFRLAEVLGEEPAEGMARVVHEGGELEYVAWNGWDNELGDTYFSVRRG